MERDSVENVTQKCAIMMMFHVRKYIPDNKNNTKSSSQQNFFFPCYPDFVLFKRIKISNTKDEERLEEFSSSTREEDKAKELFEKQTSKNNTKFRDNIVENPCKKEHLKHHCVLIVLFAQKTFSFSFLFFFSVPKKNSNFLRNFSFFR